MRKAIFMLACTGILSGCGNGANNRGLIGNGSNFVPISSGSEQIGSAFNEKCKLEAPISLETLDLLEDDIELKNVELNRYPRFTDDEAYNHYLDHLTVHLYNIWYVGKTGKLGANISIDDKLESIGFSPTYYGNFAIQGGKTEVDGLTTYHTRIVRRFDRPPHAIGDAVDDLKVLVKERAILGLQLTSPVFRITSKTNEATWVAFTGEHQTLCIKSADLSN